MFLASSGIMITETANSNRGIFVGLPQSNIVSKAPLFGPTHKSLYEIAVFKGQGVVQTTGLFL